MKRLSSLLIILLLTSGTTPAFAQDDAPAELTAALQDCVEAVNDSAGETESPSLTACVAVGSNACQDLPGGASTQGISQCNKFEEAFWDDMLNNAYANLKDSLAPDVFASLKAAQLAWVPWRDAKCKFVYENSKEGTISQVYYSSCLMGETANRAIELIDAMSVK